MSGAGSEEACLLSTSPASESRGGRRIPAIAAATVGVLGVIYIFLDFAPTTAVRGATGRNLDGGCGATCGKHSKEVQAPETWIDLLKRGRSWNNASLLEAYVHAAFALDYNCTSPKRLPGPVIPGIVSDGGYVVCDEPDVNWHVNDCELFSFGIASDDTFEAAIAKKFGCEVHEFDPTVSGSVGAQDATLPIHFHKMGCWSHNTTLSIGPVDSIENLVRKYRRGNKSLNLKIDVEGAEWETLPAIPDWLFDQVDHLILEIHTTVAPQSPFHPEWHLFEPPTLKMVESLARIREKFYLLHWHVNNCCDPTPLGSDYGVPVWNTSGMTAAQVAVAAPGSTSIGHDLVVPRYSYGPLPLGIPRGPAPNLPDGTTAPPGLAVPGPIELTFLRKSLIPGKPEGPFDLHEELNGANAPDLPLINSSTFPLYGWNSSFDRNWGIFKPKPKPNSAAQLRTGHSNASWLHEVWRLAGLSNNNDSHGTPILQDLTVSIEHTLQPIERNLEHSLEPVERNLAHTFVHS